MADFFDVFERFDLFEQLAHIHQSSNFDEATEAIERLTSLCGFDYCVVMTAVNQDVAPVIHIDHTHSNVRKATRIYTELEMARDDPVAHTMLGGRRMVDATPLIYSPGTMIGGRTFARVGQLLRAHHIGAHGLAVFETDPGFASNAVAVGYANRSDVDDFPTRFAAASWMLLIAAQALRAQLLDAADKHYSFPLTSSELAVLRALGEGMRPQEIATTRGKSLATVRKQLDSARRRLSARTLPEAISRATLLGLMNATGRTRK